MRFSVIFLFVYVNRNGVKSHVYGTKHMCIVQLYIAMYNVHICTLYIAMYNNNICTKRLVQFDTTFARLFYQYPPAPIHS